MVARRSRSSDGDRVVVRWSIDDGLDEFILISMDNILEDVVLGVAVEDGRSEDG